MLAVNAWAFQPHPEVWFLVVSVIAMYIYSIRRIGPKAVAPGETIVTRKQVRWFVAAVTLLWVATDWPIHDVAEKYLYSAHMLQHMMLSYFMPPMALLATPEWLARLIIGNGRSKSIVRWCCKPVVAGVAFNATIMITHIPALVNRSAENTPIHYLLHVILVTTAFAMWMALCGPIPEWRLSSGTAMIYVFLLSVVPTVPAGWLTFADGVVYKHYQSPTRVFGLSPTYDQQLAGVIMKIGGSVFLWTIVVVLFFKRFAGGWGSEQGFRTYQGPPLVQGPDGSMIVPVGVGAQMRGGDMGDRGDRSDFSDLTVQTVLDSFERTPAPTEP